MNPNATDDGSLDDGDGDYPDDGSDDSDDDYYDESIGLLGHAEDIIEGITRLDEWPSPIAPSKRHNRPHHRRMVRKRRVLSQHIPTRAAVVIRRDDNSVSDIPPVAPPLLPTSALPAMPTSLPEVPGSLPPLPAAPPNPLTGTTTRKGVAGTPAPAEAHAKTSQEKAACTPSPTKSLVPSASKFESTRSSRLR